jgi:tetratricopeptide (TPR) repeat protein
LFKHALVRDAASGLLLRDARKDLHACIGTKLEEVFPDITETKPDLLAYHFTEGSVPKKAAEYWLKTGKLAVTRGTMTEALSDLDKGFALLSGIPDDGLAPANGAHSADFPSVCIDVDAGRFCSGSTRGIRARPPAMGNCRPASGFEPNLGLFWHHFARGELELAGRIATDIVEAGTARSDVAVGFLGRLFQAEVSVDMGNFAESRDHCENALMIYDPVLVSRRNLYNAHIGILIVQSRALFCLGHLDEARLIVERVVGEAHRISQTLSQAVALLGVLLVEREIQSPGLVLEHAEELIALKFGWHSSIGGVFRSWCLSALGRGIEGARLVESALSDYRATGALRFVPYFLMLHADAYERTGHRAAALQRLAEAIGLIEEDEGKMVRSRIAQAQGELLKADDECDQAEACFLDALAVARHQDARTWELRTASSLARLWRDQGKRDEARGLLAPVYGWFTEGFDTLDLKEAKALLDELS